MKSFLKTKDFFKSQEEFELLMDEDLEMLVTSPQPEDLEPYYNSDDYISHTDAKGDLVSTLYQAVKKYSLKQKLNLISKYTVERKLLDVGAGTGDFMVAAKRNNWTVNGVEPNTSAQERALEKGILLESDLEELTQSNYTAITLWHVLEHLPDLEKKIEKLGKLLDKDGVLVIAVPNYRSYDAKYYGKLWAAYDVPRHLWHFSKNAIKMLFGKHGFKLVATKPMPFDAFYVSLLSEKFKNSNLRLFRAFTIGLISNLKAIFTGEYSSLIYILKKEED